MNKTVNESHLFAESMEDYEDVRDLRLAKEESKDEEAVSLEEAIVQLGL